MNDILELLHVRKLSTGSELYDINLHVYSGMINTILSNNDQQCAVLSAILRGETDCDGGMIFLNGQHVGRLTGDLVHEAGIYTVFSHSRLFLRNSVAENLFVIGRRRISLRPIRRADLEKTADEFLENFGLRDVFKPSAPLYQYSEAQCHVLELLRAVAQGARLIICENIFENATAGEMDMLVRLLMRIKAQNISLLLFVNRFCRVMEISDRAVVLRNGATVYNLRSEDMNEDAVAVALSGSRIDRLRPQAAQPELGSQVLSLQGVRTGYALKDISFTLCAGEILGLFDMHMSMCAELEDVLCRAGEAEGRIRCFRHSYELGRRVRFPENTISYIAENTPGSAIFKDMSLYDNVTLTVPKKLHNPLRNNRSRVCRYMFSSALRKLGAEDLIEELGRDAPLLSVSVNSRLKILFARCLCSQTKIIFITDTHSNRSPDYLALLRRMLQVIKAQGLSVIYVSNDLPFLKNNCDRILCLKDGCISGSIDTEAL